MSFMGQGMGFGKWEVGFGKTGGWGLGSRYVGCMSLMTCLQHFPLPKSPLPSDYFFGAAPPPLAGGAPLAGAAPFAGAAPLAGAAPPLAGAAPLAASSPS